MSECRCYVSHHKGNAHNPANYTEIVRCPLHDAAPDLLEACQSALRELRATDHRFPFEEAMEAAMAKAQGEREAK